MNRHQVLTGAVNSGDYCHAVGYVEGVPFVAYGAGCDVVILAADFQRVQIIPGATHGNVQISCLDCSHEYGKIAASYGPRVCVFEPIPHHREAGETRANAGGCRSAANSLTKHRLDYKWQQTASVDAECHVASLSWNLEGTRLLTAGRVIQMWFCPDLEPKEEEAEASEEAGDGVVFSLGAPTTTTTTTGNKAKIVANHQDSAMVNGCALSSDSKMNGESSFPDHRTFAWRTLWRCVPSSPVYLARFSHDGSLFATVGHNDRLVKIWYEQTGNIHASSPSPSSSSPGAVNPSFPFVPGQRPGETHFSFVYVAHPRAVTGFQWRRTSKYMPRGSVANVLVTSSKDNISRLWAETILPEDCVSASSSQPASALVDPSGRRISRHHIHKHKGKMMARIKHIRKTFHGHKFRQSERPKDTAEPLSPTAHDLHKFGSEAEAASSLSVGAGFHFHLAATINPETDIPLLPNLTANGGPSQFIIQWLNNKEMYFTLRAEEILVSMSRKALTLEAALRNQVEQKRKRAERAREANEDSDEDEENEAKKRRGKNWFMKKHEHLQDDAGAETGEGKLSRQGSAVSMASADSDAGGEGPLTPHPTWAKDLASPTEDHLWAQMTPGESLDLRIEALVRDWHESADMLFGVHPLDGSLLVWLVDFLDEYIPGSYRQAQISFSSQIPNVFPLADAFSASFNFQLYCTHSALDLKSVLGISSSSVDDEDVEDDSTPVDHQNQEFVPANAAGKNSAGQNKSYGFSPNILLLSKHNNGSLNQWQLNFAHESRFCTVLSVVHASRACGHRFRMNDVSCHPVFPLLLSTSHHNQPQTLDTVEAASSSSSSSSSTTSMENFCSELILWSVESVGPLSKSGGIEELARINSPHVSAFSHVAWIPTLLPSHTLGGASDSPSAVFVASDGKRLRIYQAVIDARSLLMEINGIEKRSSSELAAATGIQRQRSIGGFNVVSMQSTGRPGCILELESLADSDDVWQQTQLLHAFQEQTLLGRNAGDGGSLEAVVDLRGSAAFRENFYLVIVETRKNGVGGGKTSMLHTWKIELKSLDHPDTSTQRHAATPRLRCLGVHSTRVYSEPLPLPMGVHVVCASVAAGHLPSSSLYPGCYAPYLLGTACSDGSVRFWSCRPEIQDNGMDRPCLEWSEWEMFSKAKASVVEVLGFPVALSCAYSGRFCVAYRDGCYKSLEEDSSLQYDSSSTQTTDVVVSVFECESTGGSDWILEDSLHFRRVRIPKIKDLRLNVADFMAMKERRNNTAKSVDHLRKDFPSLSSLHKLRADQEGEANAAADAMTLAKAVQATIRPKQLVHVDWAAVEDGSYVLTVGVGARVITYAPVAADMATSTGASEDRVLNPADFSRPSLQRTKTLAVEPSLGVGGLPPGGPAIKWVRLRAVQLSTADALPPLPVKMSWVRNGLLVLGMDNEMQVYSQWKSARNLIHRSASCYPSLKTLIGGLAVNDDDNDDGTPHLDDAAALSRLTPQLASGAVLKPSASLLKLSPSISSSIQRTSSHSLFGDFFKKRSDSRPRDVDSVDSGGDGERDSGNDLRAPYIQECGLFEAAKMASHVLPQYHPKQLLELMNSGKVNRVKAILAHLVRCICVAPKRLPKSKSRLFAAGQRRSMADLQASSSSETHTPSSGACVEIDAIPPLPLFALLAADDGKTATVGVQSKVGSVRKSMVANSDSGYASSSSSNPTNQDYSLLFSSDFKDEVEEEFNVGVDDDDEEKDDDEDVTASDVPMWVFGPRHVNLLTTRLSRVQLPGLTSLDQMYLLALADVVASIRQEGEAPSGKAPSGKASSDAVDAIKDCGLRFLAAMRHHAYLLRTLPMSQRAPLKQKGLSSANIAWAFHSEAEEELLSLVPCMQKDTPTWSELREFKIAWWVRNNNSLRRCLEKVAKAAYQKRKDPLDAAIFYLAMKKKNVLWGLFRSGHDEKMTAFFRNNFTEDRWRKAALKNAFTLMSKQRFEHAAAFFLLAGALKDAVEVCLHKLQDLDLAMVLARLYEDDLSGGGGSGGSGGVTTQERRLLYEEILGCDANGANYSARKASTDPFKRSMAYWLVKDYSSALTTLLEMDVGRPRIAKNHSTDGSDMDAYFRNPSVFYFYNYLRTHPLILKQQQVLTAAAASATAESLKQSSASAPSSRQFSDVSAIERRLYFLTAHVHFTNGCPSLALEVLSKLPNFVEFDSRSSSAVDSDVGSPRAPRRSPPSTANDVDWSAPSKGDGAGNGFDDFDWSAPVTRDEPKLDLNWSEDEEEEEEEEGGKEKESLGRKDSSAVNNHSSPNNRDENKKSGQLDIMAQQLKFIACLKILMEELSTLATGFEADGGQLRYYLYIWLDKEVEALKNLCGYHSSEDDEASRRESQSDDQLEMSSSPPDASRLHDLLFADKLDLEAKIRRLSRRKRWLTSHAPFLRTLLSYCALHGADGGGLASVRMELILLLQELQQEKPASKLLSSPLPFPTTLPLLSASVAPSKTVHGNDPLRYLENLTKDILHSVNEISLPPGPSRYSDSSAESDDAHFRRLVVLRNLGCALSACIYQSLCDADSFSSHVVDDSNVGMEGFTSTALVFKDSYLMARSRTTSSSETETRAAGKQRRQPQQPPQQSEKPQHQALVTSSPSKWPGVHSLRMLLTQDDSPSRPLHVLLCEAAVAVYLSLLVHSLSTYDPGILFRLVSQPLTTGNIFSVLFGGGNRRQLSVPPVPSRPPPRPDSKTPPPRPPATRPSPPIPAPSRPPPPPTSSSPLPQRPARGPTVIRDHNQARADFVQRVVGPKTSSSNPSPISRQNSAVEDGEARPADVKPAFQETFVPPEMSLINYFLSKPTTGIGKLVEYDSDDDQDDEYDDDDDDELNEVGAKEHLDPQSYSWCLLRYVIVRYVLRHLRLFLPSAGLELSELAVSSPLLHGATSTLEGWASVLLGRLEAFPTPPPEYIPQCYVETSVQGPSILKYKAMLEPNNTPFPSTDKGAGPCRRLWHFLITQTENQDIFIRYIFKKKPGSVLQMPDRLDGHLIREDLGDLLTAIPINGFAEGDSAKDERSRSCSEAKTLHKEQDLIPAFCLNRGKTATLALATEEYIQELDVTRILRPEAELVVVDIEGNVVDLDDDAGADAADHFLGHFSLSALQGATGIHLTSSSQSSNVILKRGVDGVRRMTSHPHLPYYLSGGADGAVHVWEWGHHRAIATPRPAGAFPKVTRLRFNAQGNKFGVCDGEGGLCLFHIGVGANGMKPFYSVSCHSKAASDFAFVGASSLLASSGHSSDGHNVAVWDSLMPQRSARIQAFSVHEGGSPCLLYSPKHQVLVSGGQKGDVSIIDLRANQLRHTFHAHDTAVKCLALDPTQESFATGAADGDIKIWGLGVHGSLHSFPAQHVQTSSFFRQGGAGVSQLLIAPSGSSLHSDLISSGADGSVRVRHLYY